MYNVRTARVCRTLHGSAHYGSTFARKSHRPGFNSTDEVALPRYHTVLLSRSRFEPRGVRLSTQFKLKKKLEQL
jgi:hypothetical protein